MVGVISHQWCAARLVVIALHSFYSAALLDHSEVKCPWQQLLLLKMKTTPLPSITFFSYVCTFVSNSSPSKSGLLLFLGGGVTTSCSSWALIPSKYYFLMDSTVDVLTVVSILRVKPCCSSYAMVAGAPTNICLIFRMTLRSEAHFPLKSGMHNI